MKEICNARNVASSTRVPPEPDRPPARHLGPKRLGEKMESLFSESVNPLPAAGEKSGVKLG